MPAYAFPQTFLESRTAKPVADTPDRSLVACPSRRTEEKCNAVPSNPSRRRNQKHQGHYALTANRGNLAIFSSGDTLSSKKMSLIFAFFLLFFSPLSSFLASPAAPATTLPMRSSTDACIAAASGAPLGGKPAGGAPKPGRGGSAEGMLPGRGGGAPFVGKGSAACGGKGLALGKAEGGAA